MIYIGQATFRVIKDGPMRPALAVLTAPGMSDVINFIEFDDKGNATVFTGEVWDYQLTTYNPITVQSGAASFDLG